MAIQTPVVNTNINNPEIANANRDMLLRALLQGQEGGIAGANKAAEQTRQANIDTSAKDSDMKRVTQALKSGELPPGASAVSGSFHVGQDPTAHNAGKAGAEYQKLGAEFSKLEKSHAQLLDRLQNAFEGLQRGDAVGLKQATVGLAGVTEGPSQRLLQGVISGFGGDASILGNSEKMENFFTGLQNSGKSEAYKQSLQKALEASYANTKNNYNASLAEFKSLAPSKAPLAASQPGFSDQLNNFGGGLTQRFAAADKVLSQLQQSKQALPPNASAAPPQGGIIDTVKDKLRSYFNQVPQTSAQAAPPTPTTQAPPAGGIGSLLQSAPTTIRVKHKASGQTGTIPSAEFDPAQYDKI